jgi:hypothetical protein
MYVLPSSAIAVRTVVQESHQTQLRVHVSLVEANASVVAALFVTSVCTILH